MATRGYSIGVAGATGALGSEVLAVLDARQLRLARLVALAGEDSLGSEIEFQGEIVPVHAELPPLAGLDVLVNCAPHGASADIVRAALRAEVPCIDVSGAFAERIEVPLAWIAGGDPVGALPLLASPVDAALVWLPLLRALGEIAPLVRVTGTILEAASASGRAGIDALSAESLALFNQQELPEEGALGRPLAFDCHPTSGEQGGRLESRPLAGGRRARERALATTLARLLEPAPAVSARWIQVPAFVGQMSSLVIAWERPVEAAEATERLAKAPGVELWSSSDEGPNLRAVSGRDVVVASRPEPDAAEVGALRLWAAADLLRLAASHAVALAVARLEAR